MRILILLDHSRHGASNSFYPIANAMLNSTDWESVWIASRGISQNTAFFLGQSDQLFGRKLDCPLDISGFPEWIDQSVPILPSDIDTVLLRLPRPIAPGFWPHVLHWVGPRPIVNHPEGIEKTSNKAFLLGLDRFTVPMRLVESIPEMYAFKDEFPIVLKPLEDYGGRGLVRIAGNEVETSGKKMSFGTFAQAFREDPQPYLAMQYLDRVREGDKRIVVAGGKILTQSLRLPAEDNWLCNVAQGGTNVQTEVTPHEKEMVEYLNPILAAEGIFLYGLDTLMGPDGKRVISEVNTLSVGGLHAVDVRTGRSAAISFAKALKTYIHDQLY